MGLVEGLAPFFKMTSEEIKAKEAIAFSVNSWLREIAYQLARLNEHQAKQGPRK